MICKALVCRLLEIDLAAFWRMRIDTGSITTLSRTGKRWILEHLNSDYHLAPLADERILEDF